MIKKKEVCIIFGIMILCIGILIYQKNRNQNEDKKKYLIVTSHDEIVMEVPLSDNLTRKITTENGYNIVSIDNGQASVLEADCKNQICVHSRRISDSGEAIACLPHGLFLEIQSK